MVLALGLKFVESLRSAKDKTYVLYKHALLAVLQSACVFIAPAQYHLLT